MVKRSGLPETTRTTTDADDRFTEVVRAFARDRQVSRETRKGFGSGALKVNGRIFAMLASKGEFVVKLPKDRVDELIAGRAGTRFEPGPGRVMKEWLVVRSAAQDWISLAKEARRFVGGLKS